LSPLIEHPNALPADAALRIDQEILTWIAQEESNHRCDHVIAAEARIEAAA
jgi:hypothetical protein